MNLLCIPASQIHTVLVELVVALFGNDKVANLRGQLRFFWKF